MAEHTVEDDDYLTTGAGAPISPAEEAHFAEKDAGFRRWIPDDQHGYSIALCGCEGGPYLGARKMGTPCCCERCGFMTWDQYRFLRDAITPPGRTDDEPQ
jgi:hypothetical protein